MFGLKIDISCFRLTELERNPIGIGTPHPRNTVISGKYVLMGIVSLYLRPQINCVEVHAHTIYSLRSCEISIDIGCSERSAILQQIIKLEFCNGT